MICEFEDKIFTVQPTGFDQLALEIFQFQYQNNPVYQQYVNLLPSVGRPSSVEQIPFLPIRFFKTYPIQTGSFSPETVFESSGTTQTGNSRHYIKDLNVYRKSFLQNWQQQYGPVKDWCIIGLLPSYLEREHSSLVFMADELIRLSGDANSGFYLYEYEKLHTLLTRLEQEKQKTMLIGVTFALLEFAEKYPLPLKHTVIMETGGMKGRRREMTRQEVHDLLKKAFGIHTVHSEYGMTELLSQAYSAGEGIYNCPPWMKVLVRNEEDPFEIKEKGSGVLDIIDLSNLYSCSFIATDDVGVVAANGSFTVQGRVDNSDIRGCSLLVTSL